jgi:spore maturation protein CgeB
MKISILGLTITSAWGNGHATTYRSLCQALAARGHSICFLEKNAPWYSEHRDLPAPSFCEVTLYGHWHEAAPWLAETVTGSDLIIVGSYFPDGIAAAQHLFEHARCPIFFYDIDTPVTVERLREEGETEAIRAIDIPRYDAYLSFTGGPILDELKARFGAQRALPLYCSVDPLLHQPRPNNPRFECALSYLGTYSADRQPKLEEMFVSPALQLPENRFLLAGAQYPPELSWPSNVWRFEHIPPAEHSSFYCSSRFTLNLTRDNMVAAGWSPSVRLFEAAACGAAIISDTWPGLDELLTPGKEILLAAGSLDILRILRETTESQRQALGAAARARILREHTSAQRAAELEGIALSIPAKSTANSVAEHARH